MNVLTLAALTLRDALRSRLVPALGMLLLVVVLVVPNTVQGDGTLGGEIRVVLHYTLGLMGLLLGAAVLCMAAGAVSRDIAAHTVDLTVVKPVRKAELWFGRWLGIVCLAAVLLTACGVGVWLTAHRRLGRPGFEPAERDRVRREILTARRRRLPLAPDLEPRVRAELARLRETGALPAGVSAEDAADVLRRRLRAAAAVTRPGAARAWRFTPSRTPPSGQGARVRVRLQAPLRDAGPAFGTWTFTCGEAVHRFERALADGTHLLELPPGFVRAGVPLDVRFENGRAPESHTLLFPPGRSCELLVGAGGFAGNLARALLVVWCQAAALAAIGLTAGCFFSFPVAAFSAGSLVLALLLSRYFAFASDPAHAVGHHHGPAPEPSWLAEAGEAVAHGIARVAGVVIRPDALEPLADGILIGNREVGVSVLALAVVVPVLCCLPGALALQRRELGLPGEEGP
jgi:hypothetical protein